MMRISKKRTAAFCLVVFSAVVFAGTGFAGDVTKKTKDRAEKTHRGTDFDGSFIKGHLGVISEIDYTNKFIVVGDLQWPLADKIHYFKANGRKTNESEFKPGQNVIYKFDPNEKKRKVFILQLPDEKIIKKKAKTK